MELQLQIDKVDEICRLIEEEKEYLGELKEYLPELNRTVGFILECAKDPEVPFTINEKFLIQTLKDILYGIEQQDAVFLLDVLRYGLLELYQYGKRNCKARK